MGRPRTIGTYFMYRTTVALILLFGVLTLLALYFLQRNTRQQFLSLQRSTTGILAEEMRVGGISLQVALKTAAEYWASGTFSDPLAEGFQTFGRGLIQSEPSFLSLWIVDGATFRVKGAIPLNRTILGYDCSFLLPAQSDKNGSRKPPIYWSPIGMNPFFPHPVFFISMKAGQDYCIGWVDPQLFLQYFTLPKMGEIEFQSFFAADREGNLLAHPNSQYVARRENIRSISAVKETLETGSPSLSLIANSIFGEGRIIVTTAPVEAPPWVVGVVQEEKKITIPPSVLIAWGLVFLSFFSLFSLFTARQLSQSLEREFKPIADSLEAVSKGNFSLIIPTQRFLELERLRNSFQSMVEAVREREQKLAETNSFLRTVLDTIPVQVFWKDLNLKFQGCNRLFLRDTGKEKVEDLVGLDDYAMPWKEEAERFRSEDREAMESGRARVGLEHSHILADGSRCWHLTTKIPLRNSQGEIVGVLGTTIDITTLKEREEEIRALNAELERRVEERTRDLQKANEELRTALSTLSQTQEQLLQAEKLSVLGQLSAGIAHELNTPLGAILSSVYSLTQLMDQFLQKEIPYFYYLDPEDREFYLWVLKLSRSSPSFGALHSEVEVSNLTVRLRNEGIPDPEEAAEFLSDLSLSSYIDLLIPSLQDLSKREILQHTTHIVGVFRSIGVVELAAQKASSVVKALRRYLQGGPKTERGVVEVEQDLETVLVLLQNRLKDEVQVIRRYEGVQAWGSSAALTQVWLNLITNALQAMKYRGELILETRKVGHEVHVSVIDNGPGVPEEIKPFIFEPFFTTKKQEEGVGIGLEICRAIVQEQGGRISFESEPGRTRFTVILPAYDPSTPPHTSCT